MGELLNTADRSPALGSFLVTALRLLYQQDAAGLDFWFTQQEGSLQTSKMQAPSGTTPGFYYAAGQTGWACVLIDGVNNLASAQALIDGYNVPLAASAAASENTWASAIATYLKGVLDAALISHYSVMTMAGHSGGGMVAQLLADQLTVANPGNRSRWHTFGSPKTSGVNRARVADRTHGVRWMWHADPIPLLPLTFTDAPFLLAIVGVPRMFAWSYQVHWEGGYQLVPNAVGHAEELPTSAAVAPFTSVASWLFSNESGSNTNHAIADYEAFMRAEIPFHTTPESNLRTVAPVETPPATDRRARTAAENAVVANIVNLEHRQNAVPVSLPRTQVFTATRLGRVWTVTFGGQPVCMAATRRGAKSLARHMNDAFRQLQRTPVVDPAALERQLAAYLSAASDPTGPFRPVMNTTF